MICVYVGTRRLTIALTAHFVLFVRNGVARLSKESREKVSFRLDAKSFSASENNLLMFIIN